MLQLELRLREQTGTTSDYVPTMLANFTVETCWSIKLITDVILPSIRRKNEDRKHQ
uniref:Uncharacterized protein n=1 Tax=Rhizophora mucronata TaxID=61149 RepID=A0A2P2N514_RHIMU